MSHARRGSGGPELPIRRLAARSAASCRRRGAWPRRRAGRKPTTPPLGTGKFPNRRGNRPPAHTPGVRAKGSAGCPGAGGLCCCCTFFLGEERAKGRPGRPQGQARLPAGLSCARLLLAPLRRHPRGSAGVRKGRTLVRGSTCLRGTLSQMCRLHTSAAAKGTASRTPGRPIRPAAVPDRLDIL